MTQDEIQNEWDSFIEYPERSNRMYVTTTSALLFAQHIADIAADKEREACAKAVEAEAHMFETLAAAKSLSAAIRARSNT